MFIHENFKLITEDLILPLVQVNTQVDWKTTFEGSNRAEVNQKNV